MATDSIAERREKTRIAFPREITVDEAEEHFLPYVSEHSQYQVRAQITRGKDFGTIADETLEEVDETHKSGVLTGTEVTGNIYDPHGGVMAGFELEKDRRGNTRFDSLQFKTIPGYDVEDHRAEERDIWEEADKVVSEYFEEHPESVEEQ